MSVKYNFSRYCTKRLSLEFKEEKPFHSSEKSLQHRRRFTVTINKQTNIKIKE